MPELRIKELRAGFGGEAFVRSASFAVAEGEVLAVVGPNGSGKSTMLQALMGVANVYGGEAAFGDVDLLKLPPKERAKWVAGVPQMETFAFPFPVREIVAMGRLARSTGFWETQDDHAAIDRAMSTTACEELAGRPIDQVSGGERQRVLIARALAQETPILLLDEPNTHLDLRHVSELVELVRRLAREGHVVLIALHDLDMAAGIAERFILMEEGRVAAEGRFDDPAQLSRLAKAYGVDLRFADLDGSSHIIARRP
ncbi:MAG: Hemin import ATP-binding protein HmuV [Fimbriimonadaceae bacterium]|nr:Hemin import ATP-binding protein HmuV [Fimbriimonadaceae bacterium]